MNIGCIPARMGSQRLPKKNLRELAGVPLITRAIRKCKDAGCFDEIWVNSEHSQFREIAKSEGVNFHLRPEVLGSNHATSEQYLSEFLEHHECEYLFQVHSIAPLLSVEYIREFVEFALRGANDCVLCVEELQIECAFENKPINFSFSKKSNSQDLSPVQRLTWSISGWRRSTYLQAINKGACATYAGKIGFYPVSFFGAHVVKTERDLAIAEALLPLVEST